MAYQRNGRSAEVFGSPSRSVSSWEACTQNGMKILLVEDDARIAGALLEAWSLD